jgi:hypothetical protein
MEEHPATHQLTERHSATGPELHPVPDPVFQEPEVAWDQACADLPKQARRQHLTARTDLDSARHQIYAAPSIVIAVGNSLRRNVVFDKMKMSS